VSTKDDAYEVPTGCLEGTRVDLIAKLSDWVRDGAPELTILWLKGMAGTGKTTVAATFARNMKDQGFLTASYHIDRHHAERWDLGRIVQTLAYDLAKHDFERLQAVWTVLRDDQALERLSFHKNAQLLIRQTLDVGRSETMVVVIDGLDECGAEEGVSLLQTLVMALAHYPMKLFVTSRDEVDIANMFRSIPHTSLTLNWIGVSEDVRLFWEYNLNQLCRRTDLPDWRNARGIRSSTSSLGLGR
jgi:Cdc6-like AAA superfamily ATPase